MDFKLDGHPWWNYIEEDLRQLLEVSQKLINKVSSWDEKFNDYSFIVFPAAKAYEGFLKKVFLDREFITNEDYMGKRFRIGKALNPFLEKSIRQEESVYDRLVSYCGGTVLADTLWETWKASRNSLFHWFPEEKNVVTYDEAVERVGKIVSAMDMTFAECNLN